MSEFSWPVGDAEQAARIRAAWPTTRHALPVGATFTGEVVGRRPFGVFLRIDDHPDAVGLAEIPTFPADADLPAVGERVSGEVIDHAEHNHQVKARLTGRASSTGRLDTPPAEALYQELAAHTFVTLYWRQDVFDRTVERLREQHFAVVEVNASGWADAAAMHQDLAAALDFPDYYGHNLDALNDCLRDVVAGEYGAPADAAGFVLAFTHYDRFARACPREAQIVLDILADHGRAAAVRRQRVLCLVQSDDPDLTFEPVGATGVEWNPAEWLPSRRRP